MQDNSEQIEFWNGDAGAKWAQQLPESAHAQVLEKVQAAMQAQAHQSPNGVKLNAASWLVSAR